jgi:ABC-2 type transport system permease protein
MKKYWAIFKIQLQNRMAYAGDLALQSLTIVLFMWIFMQLWKTTYSSAGQAMINGLTLEDTMWYLMMSETIMLSKPRLSRLVAASVKDGSIAYLLNKPYHFILYQLSIGAGDLASRAGFNLLAGSVIVWILVGSPPDPRGWGMVFIAFIFGWLIDFFLNTLIGLFAFVTEDVAAFEWIYSKFLLLLGGVLIPLDFLPPLLRSISLSLPFAYTIYGPARLFVDPSLERFFPLLLGQLLWMGLLGLLTLVVFSKGASRLVINGG